MQGTSHRPLALHPPSVAVAVPHTTTTTNMTFFAPIRLCLAAQCRKAAFESPSFFNPLR